MAKLSAREKMGLLSRRAEIIQALPLAKGRERLKLYNERANIIEKLTGEQAEQPKSSLLDRFIAGEFTQSKDHDFTDVMKSLDNIATLQQIKDGVKKWFEYHEAKAAA